MCERAREWASLRLDDELSEFEGALLDAHLRRCADCASYVLESGAGTAAIRGSELELLPRPVAIPLRPRRGSAGLAPQAGAAAALSVWPSRRRSRPTAEASTTPPGWRTRSNIIACARRAVTTRAAGGVDSARLAGGCGQPRAAVR